MNTNQTTTAVLIFSRSVRAEARHKKLLPEADESLHIDLYTDLVDQTRETVRRTGLPFYFIDETKQQGSSFSQKLNSAYRQIFDKGYEQVIAVGNDCPQLTAASILRASELFEHNDVVLGPARDGGSYLIGITREVFDEETLSRLPWKTAQLHRSFVKTFRKEGYSLAELEWLSDLDSASDFFEQLCRTPALFDRILTALTQLRRQRRKLAKSRVYRLNVSCTPLVSRAPPVR